MFNVLKSRKVLKSYEFCKFTVISQICLSMFYYWTLHISIYGTFNRILFVSHQSLSWGILKSKRIKMHLVDIP